jgi:hypothetical protein
MGLLRMTRKPLILGYFTMLPEVRCCNRWWQESHHIEGLAESVT